jgi:hypothetical protein
MKAVRELAAERVSGEQIKDDYQVEDSLLSRYVGNVGRPRLIHCCDQNEVHQARIAVRQLARDCGAGLTDGQISTETVMQSPSRPSSEAEVAVQFARTKACSAVA